MKSNLSVIPKVLEKDKDLAFKLAKAFFGKNLAKNIDRQFKDGTSSHLSLITFRITPMCNLNCVMCNQRGDTGVLKGKYAADEAKTVLPLEYYKKLIDEVGPKKPIFYVWGGEPFMYPHIMDLAEYAIKNGPGWSVNTNGTFLKKHAERIVRDGWDALFVSLDGFEEVNDRIRGKGSYKKVVAGIEEINRQKKLQNSNKPYTGIVTTVSNLNYRYLDTLVEAGKEYDLAWHIINLGTYTNDSIIEKHRNFMMEHLDTDPQTLKGFNNGYNRGIDGEKFTEILDRVHQIDTGYPVITVPVIKPEKIEEYYAKLEVPVRDQCSVPWFQVNIDYNGDVHFCADYPDYILGNIKDQSIMEIFNNERAQKFRRALKNGENGLFPGCIRCYQNMLFGRRRRGY
ncbi:MAG: radical SAM protein [Spirochaetaceae bacterium]